MYPLSPCVVAKLARKLVAMSAYEPDNRVRAALTAIDLGEVEWLITPDFEVADWAQQQGYYIVRTMQDAPVYEIRPGGEAFMFHD